MGLELHGAGGGILYSWYSHVPETLGRREACHIWVSGLHGNVATDDHGRVARESGDLIERLSLVELAERHRLALLVPVIPRPATVAGTRLRDPYPIALPRYVFRAADPACRRPDLQLNLMIDRLGARLGAEGYDVRDGVFIDGFSAGSCFAQRYALLHPRRVRAVAAGQCGGAMTLPEARHGATRLHWPAGVYDFRALTGGPFDREAYRRAPQLIYIGDRDTGHTMVGGVGVWPTRLQIDFLNAAFGETDPVRLENQVRYLNGIGYPEIRFRLYPGVGHTPRPMLGDVLAFFDGHRD